MLPHRAAIDLQARNHRLQTGTYWSTLEEERTNANANANVKPSATPGVAGKGKGIIESVKGAVSDKLDQLKRESDEADLEQHGIKPKAATQDATLPAPPQEEELAAEDAAGTRPFGVAGQDTA